MRTRLFTILLLIALAAPVADGFAPLTLGAAPGATAGLETPEQVGSLAASLAAALGEVINVQLFIGQVELSQWLKQSAAPEIGLFDSEFLAAHPGEFLLLGTAAPAEQLMVVTRQDASGDLPQRVADVLKHLELSHSPQGEPPAVEALLLPGAIGSIPTAPPPSAASPAAELGDTAPLPLLGEIPALAEMPPAVAQAGPVPDGEPPVPNAMVAPLVPATEDKPPVSVAAVLPEAEPAEAEAPPPATPTPPEIPQGMLQETPRELADPPAALLAVAESAPEDSRGVALPTQSEPSALAEGAAPDGELPVPTTVLAPLEAAAVMEPLAPGAGESAAPAATVAAQPENDELFLALAGADAVPAMIAQPDLPQELRPPVVPLPRPTWRSTPAEVAKEPSLLGNFQQLLTKTPQPTPLIAPLDPEPGVVYVVPFITLMVPPEVQERVFDQFIDTLNQRGAERRLKFVILKQKLDKIDRGWLSARKHVLGEIYGYVEDSGCCSTTIRANVRLTYYRGHHATPALQYEYPIQTFFDHDRSNLLVERDKLADQIVAALVNELFKVLQR